MKNSPPKDRYFLAYGKPTDVCDIVSGLPLGWHTAYWDSIDEAFCVSGASWMGPFIEVLEWQELPPNLLNCAACNALIPLEDETFFGELPLHKDCSGPFCAPFFKEIEELSKKGYD